MVVALGDLDGSRAAADREAAGAGVPAALCRALVEHRPAPDVTYQPGVDVYGRPVAPADLGGGPPVVLSETLSIALTIDLAERLGLADRIPGGAAELGLGILSVHDGRVFLDGRPLFDADRAFIAELCRHGPVQSSD